MRTRSGAIAGAIVAVAVSASVLSGCSSSGSGGDGGSGGTLRVVASTDVWGDIASRIGGDKISVTSIITDPDQDPHSYEASARTQLALSKADVVIENGGGYDDFVDTMLKSAGSSPTLINAVTVSGKTAPAGGELNEHVWYDFPTVQKVVATLVADLSAKDPSAAATFAANAKAFDADLATMEATEAGIRATSAGAGAAITEPVPLYMLTACGLVNKTPAAFSEAIEEGNDVSVKVLDETLALFHGHAVKLLAYNEQTSGAETEQVLKAAKADGVAVVPVTETLPAGKNYVSWMTGNLAAIKAALA